MTRLLRVAVSTLACAGLLASTPPLEAGGKKDKKRPAENDVKLTVSPRNAVLPLMGGVEVSVRVYVQRPTEKFWGLELCVEEWGDGQGTSCRQSDTDPWDEVPAKHRGVARYPEDGALHHYYRIPGTMIVKVVLRKNEREIVWRDSQAVNISGEEEPRNGW